MQRIAQEWGHRRRRCRCGRARAGRRRTPRDCRHLRPPATGRSSPLAASRSTAGSRLRPAAASRPRSTALRSAHACVPALPHRRSRGRNGRRLHSAAWNRSDAPATPPLTDNTTPRTTFTAQLVDRHLRRERMPTRLCNGARAASETSHRRTAAAPERPAPSRPSSPPDPATSAWKRQHETRPPEPSRPPARQSNARSPATKPVQAQYSTAQPGSGPSGPPGPRRGLAWVVMLVLLTAGGAGIRCGCRPLLIPRELGAALVAGASSSVSVGVAAAGDLERLLDLQDLAVLGDVVQCGLVVSARG